MTHYSREEFERMASDAWNTLPAWVRERVKNVAILVEDIVPETTAKKMRLRSPMDLLGLYHGVPQTNRHNDAPFSLPDVITLYQLPIEKHATYEGRSVHEAVYETLWHEVGHHFGLDEKGIRRKERQKFPRGKKGD